MGDPDVAGCGATLLDDLAPDMSKIVYMVRVRIIQLRPGDSSLSLLADKAKKVRIRPAFEEQPPLNVDPCDTEYRLRHEKTLRKRLLSGRLGTLAAQTAQPKALVISAARNQAMTAMARLVLRFDPTDENTPPPSLGSITTKIKVSTYFAAAARSSFPTRDSLVLDMTQGAYGETLPLSSLCVAAAQWQKHSSSSNPISNPILRRDSGLSYTSAAASDGVAFNAGILTPSTAYRGKTFYTAHIAVPVTLPTTKNFLPTFHSCLISRDRKSVV